MIRIFVLFVVFGFTLARAQNDDDMFTFDKNQNAADTVGKKGFCRVTSPGQMEQVRALKVSWFYSWGPDMPRGIPQGVEFVPMVWGRVGPQQEDAFRDLKHAGIGGHIKALLGFNEPDNNTQSNISVNDALDEWPMLEKTELRLGSPGAQNADESWMQDFMKQANQRQLRVDFIAVHWYGNPDVNEFLGWLNHIHQMYGKPLWITEFAPADWSAGPGKPSRFSKEQITEFMKKVLPALMACPYVERFAWFSAWPEDPALGNAALFNHDNSLTPLGKIYAGFGNSSGSSLDDPDDSMQQ